MRRGLARGALALACAALACAGLACAGLAGCGSRAAPVTSAGPPPVTVSLATSLVTAQGTWAIAVMGGRAGSENGFWQLFVLPARASRWSLATPPGVADNGGLVAAGGAASLLVGVRPSQKLAYSPLATSTDTGKAWAPGLLDAALADTPGAIAVAPSGRALALLEDGGIETAPTPGAAAAGQWSRLTTRQALAASAPGRECGLTGVHAVSFGPDNTPMVAGSCVRRGVAGVFADSGGRWQLAGVVLPAGFGADQVQVAGLGEGAALLLAGGRLLAAWPGGTGWRVSAPAPLARPPAAAGAGALRAAGFGPGGSAWVLLGGGRAWAISGPGASWRALGGVPPGTATLAPAGGSFDALAVAGNRLTVWRLATAGWSRVQVITVPIQYGSSG